MEDSSFLENYGDRDVVSFPTQIHKVGKLRDAVKNQFLNKSGVIKALNDALMPLGISSFEWFNKGVDCEILSIGGKDWHKGRLKIKVSLEFCPDEPVVEPTTASNQLESPLDDIRRMIN